MSLKLSLSGDELRQQFLALRTREDIARLLDVEVSRLNYHLYNHLYSGSHPKSYTTFQIPKKSKGMREITAPVTALKIIQRKLNQVLQHVYRRKASVHGFIYQRSIVTNASCHKRQKHLLNLDLKDFFPSVNFGRVRGMFMATPYELNAEVATVLAQICCFNNQLPQGAPTSPVIANMICAKMDSQLLRLAQKHRCIYTRYADDLTFSTNLRQFPPTLARHSHDSGQLELGEELITCILKNGFAINPQKVRLQPRERRQEETGLTSNEFPNVQRKYVRQIRAMLHAWERYGVTAAEEEFLNHYAKKYRNPDRFVPLSFKLVVKGKIEFLGMVRGKDDHIYLRFRNQLRNLAPELVKLPTSDVISNATFEKPVVLTEGESDWKHLKAAFLSLKESGDFTNLEAEFHEGRHTSGQDSLLSMCKSFAEVYHDRPYIFIFDRDTRKIVEEVSDKSGGYKNWDNNVFSFAIPVPDHRLETPDVCIELYYKDPDIKRKDNKGRRLYLSNEFDPSSGWNKEEGVHTSELQKVKESSRKITIFDDRVFRENRNVALPKSSFADYVLNREEMFNDLDVSEFKKIFEVITEILTNRQKQ